MALQKSALYRQPFTTRAPFLIFIGWLLPGAGFFFLGRRNWTRGALYLVVIHLTIVIGTLLKGGAVMPVWITDPAFSLVNYLTFIAQLGAGWATLLSLAANVWNWTALAAIESHATFEIGSFYYLVAGALNYFIITQSLDRARNKKAFENLVKE